jgi:type I restriction enzyme, S subunit
MSKPWPTVRLGEVCRMVKGTSATLKTEPGPYPLVVTAEYRRTADSWQLEDPAVCIPLVSSTGHGDAALHRVHYQDGKFALANLLVALLPHDASKCFAKYLYHLLMARKDELLVPLMQGTANVSLKEQDIAGVEIPLPPVAEQRRVVARIEELAAQIHEARTLRHQAAEEVEALFEASVGKRLSELSKCPSNKLAALTTKIGSGSTPAGGRAAYPSSGIPFIRSMNVRMRRFQWDDIAFISSDTHEQMSGTKVRPRDVLLNITGASIGRVACAPDDLQAANVNQHVAIIRPKQEVEPSFLMYWLSQPAIQDFINDEQKGATRQGFTKTQIEAFEIPLPPLPEQRRIVSELDALQAEVDALKRLQAATAAELDALLPSILDRAFKGEL